MTEIAVNAALARTINDGHPDVLGDELAVKTAPADPASNAVVVGVVVDTQRTPEGHAVPVVFLPMPGEAFPSLVLTARARDVARAREAIHEAVADADSAVPIGTVESLAERLEEMQMGLRALAMMGLLFGSLALALAGLGLYALLAYTVRRRTREIGVRLAVGAQRRDIMWLVLRQGAVLVAVGSACGLLVAIPMTALMRSAVIGIGPFEAWALIPTVAVLFLVALLASAGPAVRASRVDPVHALRVD